jgi:hypothetical protein
LEYGGKERRERVGDTREKRIYAVEVGEDGSIKRLCLRLDQTVSETFYLEIDISEIKRIERGK